jgi:hypothetical protein
LELFTIRNKIHDFKCKRKYEVKEAHKNKFTNVLNVINLINNELQFINNYIILKIIQTTNYTLIICNYNNIYKRYKRYIQEFEFCPGQV